MTSSALAKSEGYRFVHGDRPSHVHNCVDDDGNIVHQWQCNSPYCNYTLTNCPPHGGLPPIAEGHEPWRGR